MPRENIHTVFDRMTAKGLFRANPANADSVDQFGQPAYQGPVPFPKMVYHPQGKTRVTHPAEMIQTPFGPQLNNEQKALINKIVNNQEELDAALAAGWHEHPSDAVAAGFTKEELEAGAVPPPKGAANRISDLEAKMKAQEAELEMLRAAAKKGQIAQEKVSDEDDGGTAIVKPAAPAVAKKA